MLLDIPSDIIEDIVLEEETIPAFPGFFESSKHLCSS